MHKDRTQSELKDCIHTSIDDMECKRNHKTDHFAEENDHIILAEIKLKFVYLSEHRKMAEDIDSMTNEGYQKWLIDNCYKANNLVWLEEEDRYDWDRMVCAICR